MCFTTSVLQWHYKFLLLPKKKFRYCNVWHQIQFMNLVERKKEKNFFCCHFFHILNDNDNDELKWWIYFSTYHSFIHSFSRLDQWMLAIIHIYGNHSFFHYTGLTTFFSVFLFFFYLIIISILYCCCYYLSKIQSKVINLFQTKKKKWLPMISNHSSLNEKKLVHDDESGDVNEIIKYRKIFWNKMMNIQNLIQSNQFFGNLIINLCSNFIFLQIFFF